MPGLRTFPSSGVGRSFRGRPAVQRLRGAALPPRSGGPRILRAATAATAARAAVLVAAAAAAVTLAFAGAAAASASRPPAKAAWALLGPARPRQLRGGACGPVARRWSLFGWEFENDKSEEDRELVERRRQRFLCYAEGEGDGARLQRGQLRSLLECTETFCLAKHWLPDTFLDSIYSQYAQADGIHFEDFSRMACDGLLLEGKLQEYEKAFAVMDTEGTGLITRDSLGKLFAGLGRVLSSEELDRMVDEADADHDGIDFADFLGFARTHLDLKEVLQYLDTHPQPDAGLPVEFAPDAGLEEVTTVHGEAELNAIVGNSADAIVKVAFTWCRPCKTFWPKYQKFAKVYRKTRFLKIVGNENKSCKHYAREVLKVKISPMFAAYSKGKLVKTWHGANNGRFIENMEEFLPSAGELRPAREAAVAADAQLAPPAALPSQ